MNAGSIDAVLTLNATDFHTQLKSSTTAVDNFKKSVGAFVTEGRQFGIVLDGILKAINDLTPRLESVNSQLGKLDNIKQLSLILKNVTQSVEILSAKSLDLEKGMQGVNAIMDVFKGTLGTIEVSVRNVVTDFSKLKNEESQVQKVTNSLEGEFERAKIRLIESKEQLAMMKAELLNFAQTGVKAFAEMDRAIRVKEQLATMNQEFERSRNELLKFAETGIQAFERVTAPTVQYAEAIELALPPTRNLVVATRELAQAENQLQKEEVETANSTNQATQSIQRQNSSFNQGVGSANRMASATSRLGKAMSSLRMIGTMVASMMVWNFASSLVNATRETVNAKSEMEGYFQMLHFSQSEIDQFNRKLDETVGRFQRINKYALGETISSIGVEFNLTTKEMEKAMPVVSMITSEYLRAGRNVNEASLAVKDILQGEFQRLSRETGVKGDQLKEAGWSGDKKDVMGLLEALDKVGKSRNWDIFVTKANSLNDAVLILQNRFSEWSADMVNVVQPTILAVFNSLMNFGEGLSQSLTGTWEWLNGDTWGATATKIGLLSGAILTLSTTMTMYRAKVGLVEASQMGLRNSIASVVLGLKAEEIANVSVRNAIMSKILGVKAETIAERNVSVAIKEKLTMDKLEAVQTKLNTLSSEENTTVKKANAIQERILKAEKEGLITVEEAQTLATELNTAMTEANTMASLKEAGVNGGLTESFIALGGAENIVAVATGEISVEMGILNGLFYASPVGWFALAILGLASAFYVLTGGLDASWERTKQFNDTMKDTGSAYKEAKAWLDQYTKDHEGESDAIEKANGKYEEYIQNLQSASYWYNHFQTEFNGLDLTADTTSDDVLGKYGISKKQADEWNSNLDILHDGKWKYYRAEQVLNKQIKGEDSNFAKDLDEYLAKVKKNGGDMEEAYGKMKSNYENLAYHSAVANTTDSWWEWLWNSFYAGMDQFWIDWDKFWADPQWSDAIEGAFKIFGNKEGQSGVGGVGSILGLLGIEMPTGEEITEWFSGVTDYLNSHSLMELLGFDESHDYNADINNFIDEKIKKPLGDAWNYLVSFDWLFGETVSASDGSSSSDHPSFMEDLSNIIGFDVQEWINNFNADPLGTLGVELPQIDIIGMIKSLIPTGEGGVGIGDWLGELFNLDGIMDYFNTNLPTIVSTVSSTASTVGSMFSGLKTTIQGHMSGVVTNVSTGFENAKSYATTKITAMRDSVSNVIHQMTDAWKRMKDSILDSAKLIYDGVKSKFDSVKTTLSDFFTKLQNPSQWGSGFQPYSRQPKPLTARKMFSPTVRRSTGKHGAGVNPYAQSSNKKMGIKDLVNMIGVNEDVSIAEFLSLFSGGFGGWDFHEPSKKRIFDTGKTWKTAPPSIQGIGSVGDGYKVGRFWNGKPSFTFSEFEQVAQAIFSQIPYKFYYDSEWKGSWVNALLSGAVNCSDGADALIALARVFGFDGYKQHTNLANGVGHFFAVINGKSMDTTHFQNSGSWSPLGGAGIPTRSSSYHGSGAVGSKTVNIEININEPVYGVDDLDRHIQQSVEKGLQREFNDPLSGVM